MNLASVKRITIPEGDVSMISVGGKVLWKKSRLPIEYQEVEYIQSSGKQYIDSGVIASNTIITEVKCQAFAGNKAIVASGNSAGVRYQIYCSTGLLFSTSFADGYTGLGDPSATEIAVIRLDPVAKKSTYNGVEYPLDYTGSVQARSLWLFGRNQASNAANYYSTTKMWYCKMWDGDNLVRDFVPCCRKSDGKFGMYDLVTSNFFDSEGTGEFSYGEGEMFALLEKETLIETEE
jgi:hypothetical protein